MIDFKPCVYGGQVSAPPSKSISHRALICAAMCVGQTSVIENISDCDDIKVTAECLRVLGAKIEFDGNTARVKGAPLVPETDLELNCGESGSTLRFLIPFAMLSERKTIFRGSPRLMSRPLDVYEDISDEQMTKLVHGEDYVEIAGAITPGFYRLDANISSQFITGLMLALARAGEYSVIEPKGIPVSLPYILMTADIMASFGFSVTVSESRIVIDGEKKGKGRNMTIEGDWTAASVFMALNMTGSELEIDGLDDDSLQGDRIAKVFFGKIRRTKPTLSIANTPDLAPILMTLGAVYNGIILTGTNRLRGKESSRGEAMREELAKFGIDIAIGDDFIDVPAIGRLETPSVPVSSHGDHRIAMACSVLLSMTGGVLDGEGSVSKSYPKFFEELERTRIYLD